jgi:hypothetical protein
MIGNGNANAIFTKSGTLDDALMPCLAINYSIKPQAGEEATVRYSKATLTVDANGGADDNYLKILVTLVAYDETGSAGTNHTYTISGSAAKVAWSTVAPNYTAKAVHMKDVVDLLNEIPGIQAFVLNCPLSLQVSNDNFIDVTVCDIPQQPAKYLKTLYRDIDAHCIDTNKFAFFMRLGNPEERDAGSLKLIGLDVLATGTAPRVRLYRDDIRNFDAEYSATFATEQANKQMYIDTTVVTGTQTAVVDHDLNTALVYQSPLLLAIDQTDLSACVATLKVQQASI